VAGSASFSVGIFVGVGSRHERASLHGSSHFLEHVLFKGTARRRPEEIAQAIESVGGDLNAYTTKEYTCFYARVLAADADLAVDILCDMLTSSLLPPHEVEAERAVILEEITMHADDPGDAAADLAAGALFGDTGLGRPVIGSAESISALSRDQIRRHWRRHYVPGTMVVAATGQVDHEIVLSLLGPLGDATPSRPQPGPVQRQPVRPVGGLIAGVRRFEQSTATLTLPGHGIFDSRRYPLGMLSLVLGGGMASRLFVEVRERRGLTYGIDAGETAYSDCGVWSVDWQCAPGKLAEILRLVRDTMAAVAADGITDDELARARGQMRGQTVLSLESPSARLSRLGVGELLGDHRTPAEILDAYDAVTADDVQRSAAELLSHPPVIAVVGPRPPRRGLEAVLQDWPTSTQRGAR
jgi:predicted Zn-dependent peptidase